MTRALNIFQGRFGRVALLDMNHSLVLHAHPHCHVLIKVSGADTIFRVRDTDCRLTGNSLVLVNAWEPHAYLHQPSEEGTIILALYIQPAWLAEREDAFGASARPDFFAAPNVALTAPIRHAADRLAEALASEADEGEMLGCLDELMTRVIERFASWHERRSIAPRPVAMACDFRVRKAIGYMNSNIGRAFTLNDVARESGLSRSHMFHLFQDNLNLSPNLYYNTLRTETAVCGLAAGGEPLAELSHRLGFAMQSHFTRFCRTNLGVTPGEYRRVVTLQAVECA